MGHGRNDPWASIAPVVILWLLPYLSPFSHPSPAWSSPGHKLLKGRNKVSPGAADELAGSASARSWGATFVPLTS